MFGLCCNISGGNTFYLLQEIVKKDLFPVIHQKLEEGVLYIGESAGAALACEDIKYMTPMDSPELTPNLKSTKALGLFSIPVIPHADHPQHGPVAKQIAKTLPHSISLNEDQALFIEIYDDGHESILPLNSILGPGFKSVKKKYF
ncbi:MAG: type 1 glutamine amidotransferase-like domain-containing protein [Proteobacteria bacterium]|nr:type 1 glutamine amidotransferase-like domain-containing protein [Pseudomonadota bacterium]